MMVTDQITHAILQHQRHNMGTRPTFIVVGVDKFRKLIREIRDTTIMPEFSPEGRVVIKVRGIRVLESDDATDDEILMGGRQS